MADYEITLPAGLGGDWQPGQLRCAAKALREAPLNLNTCGVYVLLDGLADEIERQAPREPGWYHIEYEKLGDRRQSVYWWDGHGWFVGQFPGARHADFGDDATITPVTIGRADS